MFSLITVCRLSVLIAAVLIIIAMCSIIIPKCFDKKLSRVQQDYSSSMDKYFSHVKDFFEGFEVIKGFNVIMQVKNSHRKYNCNMQQKSFDTKINIYFAGWISIVFSSLMYVITFVMGGYFAIRGAMSIGLIVSLSQLVGGVVAPIEQIPAMFAGMNSTAEISRKLENMLENNKAGTKKIIKKDVNRISFNDVSFSYKGTGRYALSNINIEFEKPKKYAVVGESGSGKSTIAKLILNFYGCSSGSVLYDSVEASDIYPTINCIHQNTFLFDDTLKNNVTLYKEFTDDEVLAALKSVGLNDLLARMPQGINTNIGENGSMLSGGERQRIGIARALIRGSDFLILDEATSSLDNMTAKAIFDSIFNLKGTSCIIITHQLDDDVLDKCDCIYVMKNGQLVEKGTLKELLDRKDYFFSLYNVNKID